MDRSVLGAAVVDRDQGDQILDTGLRVLDDHVEVAIVVEHAHVEQFVLGLEPAPSGIRVDEIGVREGSVRVLVLPALVRVGRQVVEVEVVLLDVTLRGCPRHS